MDLIAKRAERLWIPWTGEAPELPEGLPGIAAQTSHLLTWYHANAEDGMELWGAVGGDCGAAGPYVLAVYCLLALDYDPGRLAGMSPRFPTFDEWAALGAAACLPGVVLSCTFIVGSELIEPPEGRALILVQTLCLPGTPAAHRWQLTERTRGGLVSV